MKKTPILLALGALAAVGATGCGSNDSSSRPSTAAPAAVTAAANTSSADIGTKKNDKLGTILAGIKGRTLYLFEADKGVKSTCFDACAATWPPLTTSGAVSTAGAADKTKLSTSKRKDGTTQVVYNGHPLYFYSPDKDAGDVYGQALNQYGGEWYAISPVGKKVESGGDSGNGGSAGSGY